MAEELFALDADDEFDPLAVDDYDIDQEDMDDDNPYDTVDYPTMRNMPEHAQREAVFTPEVQGSAEEALRQLIDRNPARRNVLLSIIGLCEGGCASSIITEQVEAMQKDNISVYAPMTFCRMLQRAGALELEEIDVADEEEDIEEGVEYLQIKETPDPIWTSTEAAMAVYASFTQGAQFRDILARDGGGIYREVYQAVMELLSQGPCKREDIERLVDTFEVVQKPRRFGGHFIDMLEKTDVIAWKNVRWTLTDLGTMLLKELQEQEA